MIWPTESILGRYTPDPNSGCWIWLGAANKKRYGRIMRHRKTYWAHRVFYAHYKGEIPDGLFVLHRCDNPICVNPEHLYAGTHTQNMRDMHARGRASRRRSSRIGENNPRAKLNEEQVRTIRKMAQSGGYTHKEIADRFCVGLSTISMIKTRATWSEVE